MAAAAAAAAVIILVLGVADTEASSAAATVTAAAAAASSSASSSPKKLNVGFLVFACFWGGWVGFILLAVLLNCIAACCEKALSRLSENRPAQGTRHGTTRTRTSTTTTAPTKRTTRRNTTTTVPTKRTTRTNTTTTAPTKRTTRTNTTTTAPTKPKAPSALKTKAVEAEYRLWRFFRLFRAQRSAVPDIELGNIVVQNRNGDREENAQGGRTLEHQDQHEHGSSESSSTYHSASENSYDVPLSPSAGAFPHTRNAPPETDVADALKPR